MQGMLNRQGSFAHRDFLIEAWAVVLAAGFARALSDITLEREEGAGKTGRWPHPQPRVQQKKRTS
jgi:hypothetical protein